MFLKIAWRNIWRNKRRSLITIASIMFAVFFAIAMRALQLGMYDKMISNIVGTYSGYVQVHAKGYWEEQTLDNAFELDKELESTIEGTDNIELSAPRLQSFALSATEQHTKGIMVVGIDPGKDAKITGLQNKLAEGNYLETDDKALLIGKDLAAYHKLNINDTLVLLGQGRHGVTAAGKYAVKGIVNMASPQLNSSVAFLPIKEAETLYGAESMATAMVLQLPDDGYSKSVIRDLRSSLDTAKFEVMGWEEMLPELKQTIEADSAGGVLMLFILYMVISFGIFGTVLMMTAERKHEYGVLLAVGMKRRRLAWVTLLEMMMMALTGVVAGILLAYPLTMYFNHNPIALTGQTAEAMEKFGFEAIIPMSVNPSISLTHGLTILIITLAITLYPALVIRRMRAVSAMRG